MPRRFLRRPFPTLLLAALLLCSLGALDACAHRAGGESAAAPAQASMAPPSHSKLARIHDGMNDSDVRRILGEPTSAHAYITGKMFIPFYYGTDTMRTDWKYKGLGSVTFSRNQYTGALKVIRVQYDPRETGS